MLYKEQYFEILVSETISNSHALLLWHWCLDISMAWGFWSALLHLTCTFTILSLWLLCNGCPLGNSLSWPTLYMDLSISIASKELSLLDYGMNAANSKTSGGSIMANDR